MQTQLKCWRSLTLLITVGLAWATGQNRSHAALLAYEPFTNASGTEIIGAAGGTGFSGAWQSNSSQGAATNTGYGLSYTDAANNVLATSSGAGFFQGLTTANNNMQPIRLFNFSRGTNGTDGVTTWVSFLIARQGPTGSLAGNLYGRGANVPHDLNAGAIQKLAIGNGSGAGSNTVALIPQGSGALLKGATNIFGGVTNFVVVRIDHIAGGNDNAYLFVNPTLGVEPGLGSAGAVSLGAYDFSFDRLRVFAGGQNGAAQPYAELVLDEYRVGETYADVTPFTPGPPPVTPQGLVITNAVLIPGHIVLSGTGGSNGGTYQLLASSILTAPASVWPTIATNSFDASGNFILTNPILAGAGEQFYRLKISAPPAPIPPTITLDPTNQTVLAGQSATFTGAATGTVPLAYQWFFNTSTAVAGATNATLTITNAQTANVGTYSLRVTNAAGPATSAGATLTVNYPPAITTAPQSQTVTLGNSAGFTVAATGTAPLSYQWYFNTNTSVAGANSAMLTITNAQLVDAGVYSVLVTNHFGAITSSQASLTVNLPSAQPDFSMIGFATLDGFATNNTLLAGGTTGGAAGPIVVASNLTWLVNYAQRSNQPLRVLITADIDCSSLNNNNSAPGYQTGRINVNNHKTIYSTNGATISRGTLNIGGKSNVIVRNLKFRDMFVFDPSGAYDTYGWDYVVVTGSHHVWVDHCDFERVYDGLVDVVNGSDYVTVSWNVFRNQKKCSLVGNSDSNGAEDRGHLNVTYHHNWFSNVDERTPRMRFGNAHVFNQYTDNRTATNGTGRLIQATAESAVLVENIYLTHATNAYPTVFVNGGLTGNCLKVTGSVITNSPGQHGFQQLNAATFSFNAPWVTNAPPYSYWLDAVADVPSMVTNWAGVGKLTSF